MNIEIEKSENQAPKTGKAKIVDILWKVFAIVLIVVAGIWIMSDSTEHVEDTNGADDYSLTTITDDNIIKRNFGSTGDFSIITSSISNENVKVSSSVDFSANKYTGITEILYDNFIGKSDFYIEIFEYKVLSGNVKLVVVRDDTEIVAVLEPDEEGNISYAVNDVEGYYSLRIAGESARFSFSMSDTDYNYHSHD